MPLVISRKTKRTSFVPNEEVLGEILGHSNFDGEKWAIGDVVIFEDGTTAEIELVPGDKFHVLSEPKPAELEQVIAQIEDCEKTPEFRKEGVRSWKDLFEMLSVTP